VSWVVRGTGYVQTPSEQESALLVAGSGSIAAVLFSVPRERPVQLQPPVRLKRPPGSRSRPDTPTIGVGDRVYESTKLAAVFDMLASHGCPVNAVLRDVNIALQEVHSPQARISLLQLITVCQNAIRLSTDRHLPYRIGASIHISTYGMYGYPSAKAYYALRPQKSFASPDR
jgi:Arabinose-binding domain of AraC transcription regulator, N-term